jgi:hypothetical protein
VSSTLDNWDDDNYHMRDGYFTDDLLCARSAVSFVTGCAEVLEGMSEITTKTIYMSARNHERMCELLCILAQDVFTACKGVMAGRFLVRGAVNDLVAGTCRNAWRAEPEDTPFFKAAEIVQDSIIVTDSEDVVSRCPAMCWQWSNMPCLTINLYSGMIYVSNYSYTARSTVGNSSGGSGSNYTSWRAGGGVARPRPVVQEILAQYRETEPLREMDYF